MAGVARIKRENCRSVWSVWKPIITATPVNNWASAKRREKTGDERIAYGYVYEPGLRNIPCACGVYELKADNGEESYVVYIGSTCRKRYNRKDCSCSGDKHRCYHGEPCSLKLRITEYARYGSHKAELINNAIHMGFDIYVRYINCRSTEVARVLEGRYLALYDYAWNLKKNGDIRPVP